MSKKWFVGVTHSHTTASDGKLNLEKIVALAKRNKLDFLMITDHNKNCEEFPEVDSLTLIYGTELSCRGGHTNIWGVRNSVDNFVCESYEQWLEITSEAKKRGAYVCMNHPLCSCCPWRWEKDLSKVDAVEVWNSPMHYDNLACTTWWRELLKAGCKISVVGGSDFHRDYYITNLLTNPVTYVYADSASSQDILEAISAGHTTISPGVGKTFIELRSGNAVLGDTVKLSDTTQLEIDVRGLKKNHRLVVFDSDGEFYSHTAEKAEDFSIALPVKKSGFVCAQVEYKPSKPFKFIYNIVIGKRIPQQKGIDLPPFIYAQSGAIFFE